MSETEEAIERRPGQGVEDLLRLLETAESRCDALTAQVAELTAERDTWRQTAAYAGDVCSGGWRERAEKAEAQVAAGRKCAEAANAARIVLKNRDQDTREMQLLDLLKIAVDDARAVGLTVKEG